MEIKINSYELCDHVIEVNNGIENIIGMIKNIDKRFEAIARNGGCNRVTEYEVFDDKQTAINYVKESYDKLNFRNQLFVGQKLKNSPFDEEASFELIRISETLEGTVNYTVKNLETGKIQKTKEIEFLYPITA